MSLGLPMLVTWVIGIPILSFMMLKRRKDEGILTSKDTKEQFGFLYNGYREEAYYWEIIIMITIIINNSVIVAREQEVQQVQG